MVNREKVVKCCSYFYLIIFYLIIVYLIVVHHCHIFRTTPTCKILLCLLVVGLDKFQDVPRLALQRSADRVERRQPHRLCLIIF